MTPRILPIHKLAGLIYLAFALLALYSTTRLCVLLTSSGDTIGDAVIVLLVLAELLLVVHGVRYFDRC
jgi:hypothetical protein